MKDLLNDNNDFGIIYERKKGEKKHYYLGCPGDDYPTHSWMEHIAAYVQQSMNRSQIAERKKDDKFKEAKTGLQDLTNLHYGDGKIAGFTIEYMQSCLLKLTRISAKSYQGVKFERLLPITPRQNHCNVSVQYPELG